MFRSHPLFKMATGILLVIVSAIGFIAFAPHARANSGHPAQVAVTQPAKPWHPIAQVVSYQPVTLRVQPGGSLSGIAARVYGRAGCWPAIYRANRAKVGPDPNLLRTGMRLRIPAPPKRCPSYAPVRLSEGARAPVSPSGYGAAPGTFEACVIQRESGGDPRAYNPASGASGLFGDLLSTWLSLGLGYPNGAYTAPPSVQYKGFDILYARDGMSPWDSDGCPALFGGGRASAFSATPMLLTAARHRTGKYHWRLKAVSWILKQRGCWYDMGGTNCRQGFDCSGLLYAGYKAAGAPYFGRSTYDMLGQYGVGSGRLVPVYGWRNRRRGDLAFYGSGHVEMWWGHDTTFGAADWGTQVGWHHFSWSGWHPTMFFRVV